MKFLYNIFFPVWWWHMSCWPP